MSGIRVDLDIQEVVNAASQLERIGDHAYDFFDEIGAQLVDSTQQRFDAGAGPDGTAWRPSQRAVKRGTKTLVDRGELQGELSHNATNNELEWGSDKVYAAIHHFGGKAGRGLRANIPARPFIGISAQDEMMINAEAYEFIEGLVQ